VRSRPENIGPKTSGPKMAPDAAPKRTSDIPRARSAGGNISAAAARERSTIVPAAPAKANPAITRMPDSAAQPSAVVAAARIPETNPMRITGMRPRRSPARPAGNTARGARDEEDRRSEPENPLDAGHGDERHRRQRDDELDHPGEADHPAREQEGVTPDGVRLHVAIQAQAAARLSAKAAAPPRDGWRR
jgi:hypothetical protein